MARLWRGLLGGFLIPATVSVVQACGGFLIPATVSVVQACGGFLILATVGVVQACGGFLILATVGVAEACDGIVVGRLASADGSVLLGHNEENALDRVIEFRKIPKLRHDADAKVDLGRGGRIDAVSETSAFLWSENPGLEFSDGYLNEWGVAVASIKCISREDDYDALVARGEIREGGIGYMLRRLVAQRAKSAREGMELIGQLVERFGYADTGRTYAVADPQEAWVVEVVRGRRWVAQRVPDDAVVILPARHVIGEIDLADRANFRSSPDLISYATQRGWFDPGAGRPFNFRLAYQTSDRSTPEGRQFRGQELVTGKSSPWPPAQPLGFAVHPHKRFSVADVMSVLRDPGGVAAFFAKSTQEAAVFQLRRDMPREIGCVYWRTTGRPDISVFTPWHVGVTATPESYGRHNDPQQLLSLEHHFQPAARDLPAGCLAGMVEVQAAGQGDRRVVCRENPHGSGVVVGCGEAVARGAAADRGRGPCSLVDRSRCRPRCDHPVLL